VTSRQLANRALVDALVSVWDTVPDQRLGQLLMNLSRVEGGFADTWEWTHRDWFARLNEAAHEWPVSEGRTGRSS
jgi:hypothetical protein